MTTVDTELAPVATLSLASGTACTVVRTNRADPDEVVLEAHAETGEVVGVAVCELSPRRDRGHVSVSVPPAWRNQGVGRGLVAAMIDEGRRLGLLYLVARHTPDDEAAARMIAALGAIVARRTGDGMVRVAIAIPHT